MASFGQPLKSFWVTLRVTGDGSSRLGNIGPQFRGANLPRGPANTDMRRINHSEAFSKGGACTNQTESFFSADFAAPKSVSSTGLTANVSGIMLGMA
jgi:hypothetical protein